MPPVLTERQSIDFTGQAMISLSYDDGYRNNYVIAAPLHEQYDIPATFNIVTDWVIDNNRYSPIMTVADIIDLDSRGFEISSHSVTHPHLSELTDTEVEWELTESKQQLLNWGLSVKGFVLPYSSHANNRSLYLPYYEYVRGGRSVLEAYPPSDRYDLPCYFVVDKNNTPSQLKTAIDQAISEKKWIIVMMHHVLDDVGDADVTNNSTYYWYASQIEEVLQYIASKPENQFLSVNTIDGYRFATLQEQTLGSHAKYNGEVREVIGEWAKVDGEVREIIKTFSRIR